MASCATDVQNLSDAFAARRKARRAFVSVRASHLAMLLLDMGQHSELAHMTFHKVYRRVAYQSMDTWELFKDLAVQ